MLKLLAATKCIQFDSSEFDREFGKCGIATMKTTLKKYGIAKPRVVRDSGKVFIWQNS
jgi:hypothetical protein